MIFESILSNSFLLLVSGSSIYVLKKHSDQFSNLQRYFISASIGIFGFYVRSLGTLIYNLFIRTYPINPQEIEDENAEKKKIRKGPFRDISIFHRFCSTVGLAGLIYAVYDCNKNEIIGTVIVFSLTAFEFSCAMEAWRYKQLTSPEIIEEQSLFRILTETLDGFLDLFWIFIGGYFGWIKKNSFCLLAFLPHSISVLTLSSEEFDKNPSIQTAFHDYMTIAYILLMTEAIRQSPKLI